ncbi:hypothetical protein ARMGADRAFT_579337 [Armillaria gallica]|uniref:PAH2 domain-containing protein n=1 Tax=Armillaria gallica TaxID=47427 RepID=A0A2H3DXC0_ARMGA|nr:hypothetical protein ARMGADRAFT_579337 [Armillaria gallica]
MQTQAAGPQESLHKVDQHKDHHIFDLVTPRSRPPRGLNFTDILNYMDAFKVQFQDKPKVYNGFLAIMRDFENQISDTPGIIQQISRLFHEEPGLVRAFNMFLPAGYRIDIFPQFWNFQHAATPRHILRTQAQAGDARLVSSDEAG